MTALVSPHWKEAAFWKRDETSDCGNCARKLLSSHNNEPGSSVRRGVALPLTEVWLTTMPLWRSATVAQPRKIVMTFLRTVASNTSLRVQKEKESITQRHGRHSTTSCRSQRQANANIKCDSDSCWAHATTHCMTLTNLHRSIKAWQLLTMTIKRWLPVMMTWEHAADKRGGWGGETSATKCSWASGTQATAKLKKKMSSKS